MGAIRFLIPVAGLAAGAVPLDADAHGAAAGPVFSLMVEFIGGRTAFVWQLDDGKIVLELRE